MVVKERLRDAIELWKREDGIDGSTVKILQEIFERALALDPGPLLIVCHSYQWGDDLARWLGRTAEARSIYFEYNSSRHRGAVHDTEFIISNVSLYRLRGIRFTKIFIDNGVYGYHKLTPRLRDELQLIKQRTVLEAGPCEREEY